MQADASIQSGKDFIKEKNYEAAIREFKKALRLDKENPEAYLWLARSFLKYSLKEAEPTFLRLAEDAVRSAIKIDPYESKYHDTLIEISAKRGGLDALSTEYHKKMDKDNSGFYKDLLKKISTISILSIPEGQDTKKGRKKGKVFLNYVVMPVIVAGVIYIYFDERLAAFRFPGTLVLAGFIFFKIISRPKSKANKGQW
ncbi:MAG: tetratricopeptide repeat protein [Elusimicrobiota bacterium]|nr:tetratricopeptide repeat protein [Elusimicrobiota bacterium]